MNLTALHLIEAAELLAEVARGNAELDVRRPLVRLAARMSFKPELARAAAFMTQYAHGLVDYTPAHEHLATIKSFASRFVVS